MCLLGSDYLFLELTYTDDAASDPASDLGRCDSQELILAKDA